MLIKVGKMSRHRQHRHYRQHRKALIAVLLILVYAWSVSSTPVMASSSSSGFNVTVQVVDALALKAGKEWLELVPHHETGELESKIITCSASPRSDWNMDAGNACTDSVPSMGNDSIDAGTGDAAGSGAIMLITATRL